MKAIITKTMKITSSLLLILTFFIPSITSQPSCLKTCGKQPLQYPFGTGPGCGDPRFQQYVTCKDQKLTLTTHTGSYPITDIDYDSQVFHISDPSMSTCSCTQPSKGFSLDSDAPFSFHNDNIFALLDCSITSSPIYHSTTYNTNNASSVPLCDTEDKSISICSFLNSCRAISILNLPISTCCVYTPVDLGPSYDMDLQKLKCSSYSGFYSFNGQDSNPDNWNYGIALKYKFNVYNDFPGLCRDCERTNGVCGYGGTYNSYVCVCPSGLNSTSDCFFGASWSKASSGSLPWHLGIVIAYALAWSLVWL